MPAQCRIDQVLGDLACMSDGHAVARQRRHAKFDCCVDAELHMFLPQATASRHLQPRTCLRKDDDLTRREIEHYNAEVALRGDQA